MKLIKIIIKHYHVILSKDIGDFKKRKKIKEKYELVWKMTVDKPIHNFAISCKFILREKKKKK